MKRLKKFSDPKMVSARVERSDVEKFEALLGQQHFLTLQDFLTFSFQSFISGSIVVNDKEFVIKNAQDS